MSKNALICESMAKTKVWRKGVVCRVYEIKADESKLSGTGVCLGKRCNIRNRALSKGG